MCLVDVREPVMSGLMDTENSGLLSGSDIVDSNASSDLPVPSTEGVCLQYHY